MIVLILKKDADGYDYNDDGDIELMLMMMIARQGRADNLHGERCRRSCSDLDNCAGELPPLLHGPRAGLPCWRESESEGNPCKRESVRKLLLIYNRQVW